MPVKMTLLKKALAPFVLLAILAQGGCLAGAVVGAAGSAVGAAVDVTGDVARGTADIIIPDGDDDEDERD